MSIDKTTVYFQDILPNQYKSLSSLLIYNWNQGNSIDEQHLQTHAQIVSDVLTKDCIFPKEYYILMGRNCYYKLTLSYDVDNNIIYMHTSKDASKRRILLVIDSNVPTHPGILEIPVVGMYNLNRENNKYVLSNNF